MAIGFRVQKYQTKNGKMYQCKVSFKRVEVSESFKKRSFADNWGRKIVNQIDAGEYTGKLNIASERITFLNRLDTFIKSIYTGKDKENSRQSDYVTFKSVISRHQLSKKTLDEIGVDELKTFIKERREQEISEGTIANNLSCISRIFTYASGQPSWGFKKPNPYSLLDKDDRPVRPDHRERRLGLGEYELLIEQANLLVTPSKKGGRGFNEYLPTLIKFQANSGLRLGEVASIKPNAEMFDKKLIYLEKTKLNNPRWVPLMPLAWEALNDFKPYWGNKTIFSYTSPQMSSTFKNFKNKLLKVGLLKENLTMHDLRHESLSRLFEMYNHNGRGILSLPDILNISGHKDVKTLLETYVQIDPADTVAKLYP